MLSELAAFALVGVVVWLMYSHWQFVQFLAGCIIAMALMSGRAAWIAMSKNERQQKKIWTAYWIIGLSVTVIMSIAWFVLPR
ncbi:MAG TPA: hypothetical protein VLA96_11030 [Terriglobales bacterium]|nr:hypothetical protein [Terriglobales bacterium]